MLNSIELLIRYIAYYIVQGNFFGVKLVCNILRLLPPLIDHESPCISATQLRGHIKLGQLATLIHLLPAHQPPMELQSATEVVVETGQVDKRLTGAVGVLELIS